MISSKSSSIAWSPLWVILGTRVQMVQPLNSWTSSYWCSTHSYSTCIRHWGPVIEWSTITLCMGPVLPPYHREWESKRVVHLMGVLHSRTTTPLSSRPSWRQWSICYRTVNSLKNLSASWTTTIVIRICFSLAFSSIHLSIWLRRRVYQKRHSISTMIIGI